MKKIFSNYYKIILSVVILIVLVALKEDYKTSFDEMSGVRTVVRMLLYTAWGFLLATRTRRDKAKGAEYVAFGVACVAALNLLIPIWSFQMPLINDFLRKMAKFRHQENQDVSAGTRIRFFIDKPAAMISFPRAVIKYL